MRIDFPFEYTLRNLSERISGELDRMGLFYRMYGRVKTHSSTEKKLRAKKDRYQERGHGMQDLLGIRIVTYFKCDIDIVARLLARLFAPVPDANEIDDNRENVFGPTRYNLVFTIPDDVDWPKEKQQNIEKTFEVQVRTVFSEGWHEIEHDLRYKCKSDWIDHPDLDRALNSVIATLEVCDWTIEKIFNELANTASENRSLKSLCRNVLLIRLVDQETDLPVAEDATWRSFQGKLLGINRNAFLTKVLESDLRFPWTYNNTIFLLNRYLACDEGLASQEPRALKQHLEDCGW